MGALLTLLLLAAPAPAQPYKADGVPLFAAWPSGGPILIGHRGGLAFIDKDGELIKEIPLEKAAAAAYSRDGGRAAAALADGRVIIFSTASMEAEAEFYSSPPAVSAAFAPDGALIYAAGDGALYRAAPPAWKERKTGSLPAPSYIAGFGPAGETISYSPAEPRIRGGGRGVYTLRSARNIKAVTGGGRLAAVSGDREIRLWDISSSTDTQPLRLKTAGSGAAAFSPSGELAYAGRDGGVYIFGTVRALIKPARGPAVTALAFSPDGSRLLAADSSGRLRFIDTGPSPAAAPAKPPAPPAYEPETVPAGRYNPSGVAVIIGVSNYASAEIPRAEYAGRDAASMREHLVKALGYPETSVTSLADPSRAQLEELFGPEGRLKALVRPGETELFVYFSGHGAADPAAGEAYLLPADARPEFARSEGYSVKALAASLAALGAKKTFLVTEACYTGASQGGPLIRNASPLVLEARPRPAGAVNLLAAAGPDQLASWYPEKGHSLYTYYFLKAVRERAGGPLTLRELERYLEAEVPEAARKLYGRTQTPAFIGDPGVLLTP